MKAKFSVNDRVHFMAQTVKIEKNYKLKVLKSYVGYIKQVREGRFKTEYAICVAKCDDMFVVPEKDVFGILEKKENKQLKTAETNAD